MDQHRFDSLTRTLSSRPTRRDVLRGLAGLSFGLGGRSLSEPAEAKAAPLPARQDAPHQQELRDRLHHPRGLPQWLRLRQPQHRRRQGLHRELCLPKRDVHDDGRLPAGVQLRTSPKWGEAVHHCLPLERNTPPVRARDGGHGALPPADRLRP